MNKEIENLKLQFTPFTTEIIGADDEYVYLKEEFLDKEDKYFILKINKKLYLECCDAWLSRKSELCKHYNHFCGIFGNMSVKKYKNSGDMNLLVDYVDIGNDDLKPVYKDVPIYEIISMDLYVDMEHG